MYLVVFFSKSTSLRGYLYFLRQLLFLPLRSLAGDVAKRMLIVNKAIIEVDEVVDEVVILEESARSQRRRISSTCRNTWIRRSQSNLPVDEKVANLPSLPSPLQQSTRQNQS